MNGFRSRRKPFHNDNRKFPRLDGPKFPHPALRFRPPGVSFPGVIFCGRRRLRKRGKEALSIETAPSPGHERLPGAVVWRTKCFRPPLRRFRLSYRVGDGFYVGFYVKEEEELGGKDFWRAIVCFQQRDNRSLT